MRHRPIWPSRRDLLIGLGGTAVALSVTPSARSQDAASMALRLQPRDVSLPNQSESSPIWDLSGTVPQLRQGDSLDLTLANDLPVPVAFSLRGGAGPTALEPVNGRPPVAPRQSVTVHLPSLTAGTALCDARLLGDSQARPLPALAFRVAERQPPEVDADHLLTIADWRIARDGHAVAPGRDPGDATAVFTVNGQAAYELKTRSNARLRFRFINACQRAAIAVKIENHAMRVIAIDGQPADPFVSQGGLLLGPGSRVDALVDATGHPGGAATIQMHDGESIHPIGRIVYESSAPLRPAPLADPRPLAGNGLPEHIPLGAAQRIDMPLDAAPASQSGGWRRAAEALTTPTPVFRARRGGTVVLALTNRAAAPMTFHIHGHHMRWLDRLDDGWKPFWLDTALLQGGQTMRTAFLAEHPGAWLVESMTTDWAAPRLAQWYVVE